MLRDTLKTEDYFNAYIDYEEKRITKFLSPYGKLDDGEKKAQCAGYIASFLKNKLVAQYSRGDAKSDIAKTFNEYVKYACESGISSYADYVDLLSLVILFNADAKVLSRLKKDGVQEDSLVHFLESFISKTEVETGNVSLAFPDGYSVFYDFLAGKAGKDALFTFIEKSWYNSCKDVYWYDSHKSKEAIYAGYWCWLGAAVLKVRESSLPPNISLRYLPVDLLDGDKGFHYF